MQALTVIDIAGIDVAADIWMGRCRCNCTGRSGSAYLEAIDFSGSNSIQAGMLLTQHSPQQVQRTLCCIQLAHILRK